MVFLWILFTLLIVALAALTLLLFSPVVAEVDTRSGRVRVHWSFLLAYTRPLPGTKGDRRLSIAGLSVPLPHRKGKKARKKKEKPAAERSQARSQRQRKQVRLLWACLLDDDVRTSLMRRFAHLPVDLWEALEVGRWHSNVSLPDPALNGMLWGALAAVDCGPGRRFACNFIGRNEVQTEVRLYPHRMLKAFLLFFVKLPYWAVYRRWRAS